MPRTILIHLNVEVADDDPRTADEIISAVEGALDVGLEGDACEGIVVHNALSEEI